MIDHDAALAQAQFDKHTYGDDVMPNLSAAYLDMVTQRDEALARIADWERRSESCESKLGQLEANERVMILEDRIKASQKQDPIYFIADNMPVVSGWHVVSKEVFKQYPANSQLIGYREPVISREPELLAEIERLNDALDAKIIICGDEKIRSLISEVDELTRKLAEQQAEGEETRRLCRLGLDQPNKYSWASILTHIFGLRTGAEELNKLLSEAKKQASCTVEFIPKIVSENLGKISDSQSDKIVEMEAQIESLKQRLFKTETERGVMFEEYDKLQEKMTILRDALVKAESAFVTQVGADYNEVIHSAVLDCRNAISYTESDWLAQHDQKVLDEAFEKAAEFVGRNLYDCKTYADEIRNLKGTK